MFVRCPDTLGRAQVLKIPGSGAILSLSCFECIRTRCLHPNHSIDNIILNRVPFARTIPNGYSVCRPGLQLSAPVLLNRTRWLHCSRSVVHVYHTVELTYLLLVCAGL